MEFKIFLRRGDDDFESCTLLETIANVYKRTETVTQKHRGRKIIAIKRVYVKDESGSFVLNANGDPKSVLESTFDYEKPPADWYTCGANHATTIDGDSVIYTRENEEDGWYIRINTLEELFDFLHVHEGIILDVEKRWLVVDIV